MPSGLDVSVANLFQDRQSQPVTPVVIAIRWLAIFQSHSGGAPTEREEVMPVQAGKYEWSSGEDDSEEIKVFVPIEDSIKAKDCDVKITKKALKVGLKGQEPVIDDTLWKEIDPDESSWEIEKDSKGNRCIVLSMLKKSKWDRWEYLVKCEDVPPDTTVTNKVFMDISIDGEKTGRIVMGLYGKQVPKTVREPGACRGDEGLLPRRSPFS
eukprot:Skav233203  [mRNA]  locus=scaffold24:488539:493705:- [translate_table: standard]